MAESVDALVSNTSGAIRAGSTPAQGTCRRIDSFGSAVFVLTRWADARAVRPYRIAAFVNIMNLGVVAKINLTK